MASRFTGALLHAKIIERYGRIEPAAVASGKSYIYLYRLCRGEAQPSRATIELMAEVLGCEPGDFFADDGKSRGVPPRGPVPPLSAATREQLRALLDLSGQERGHGAA